MENALLALDLLGRLLSQAESIRASLGKAHTEGRDLTDEELNATVAADDAARAELQQVIEQHKAARAALGE